MIRLQLKQRLADFTLDLDLTLPGRGVTAIVGSLLAIGLFKKFANKAT